MDSVTRTAKDALQAKVSAFLLADYTLSQSAWLSRSQELSACYVSLLQTMRDKLQLARQGRQSPLINAGYAVRVMTIQEQILRFLKFHRPETNHQEPAPLRILVLGAGFDVMGLATLQSFDNIHLIEIDFPAICQAKEAVTRDLEFRTDSAYSLIPGDLLSLESLQKTMSSLTPLLQQDSPILILSELVLAYLPPTPCDQLLQWLSTTFLHQSAGSAMVLYEPIGKSRSSSVHDDDDDDDVPELHSVTTGYQLSYFNSFHSKLARGTHADSWSLKQYLYPLAPSISAIATRLEPFVTNAITAQSACAQLERLPQSTEMFDEHAALSLYLRSYCLCGVFDATRTGILPRIMFSSNSLRTPALVSLRPLSNPLEEGTIKEDIWITSTEESDDLQIQSLFTNCYRHLFQEYPSVHKMVKAALKKDLRASESNSQSKEEVKRSAIGQYYQDQGGIFLVAVTDPVEEEEKEETSIQSRLSPLVVGGIGVRKCTSNEKGIRNNTNARSTFEIHRLFVHERYRSRGLATKLLNTAIQCILDRLVTTPPNCGQLNFVATTLNVLEHANKFYDRQGFVVTEEALAANLKLRTYHKYIPVTGGVVG